MIRKLGLGVLAFVLLGSLMPVVLGGMFGPTVVHQRGFNEAEGLGQMSPWVFRSMCTSLHPQVSDRRPGWFWGRTPAKPGEYIIAFDAYHIVGAKCGVRDYIDLTSWFVWPTWLPAAVVWGALALVWLLITIRSRLTIRPGHCYGCGYDLTGNVSGTCPECGKPIPASSQV